MCGRIVVATLHFPNGTLYFTEAGTRKRASLMVVRGEAARYPGFALRMEAPVAGFDEAEQSEQQQAERNGQLHVLRQRIERFAHSPGLAGPALAQAPLSGPTPEALARLTAAADPAAQLAAAIPAGPDDHAVHRLRRPA